MAEDMGHCGCRAGCRATRAGRWRHRTSKRGADGVVEGADPMAIGETGKTNDVPHAVASG